MSESVSDEAGVDFLTTVDRTLRPSSASPLGYRRVLGAPGEPMQLRCDLGGRMTSVSQLRRLRSILCFVHLSDLHVTDAQSPARAEFLDRYGDDDSPLAPVLGRVGTYRAQEALTFHVVEAMVHALRRLEGGPATGSPVAFAVSTGDATDNCQENELDAYVTLLEGGRSVVSDSGDPERYEGVGSAEAYDERYWHPDGTPSGRVDDIPRAQRGFPVVPGLLDACRRPFTATGLGIPWYAAYGNHDALFGGTLPADGAIGARALGSQKVTGVSADVDVLGLLEENATRPSAGEWGVLDGPVRVVAADPRRRPVPVGEWIRAHLGPESDPPGHGYDTAAASSGRAYYGFDAGIVRCLVLDTVNPAGGWQGSLSSGQLSWLERELVAGHRGYLGPDGEEQSGGAEDRLFVLFSHHPLETLVNDYAPDGEARHLAPEVEALLARFPNVVAWMNGHTHTHDIRPVGGPTGVGGLAGKGLWQVTTASHVDWPQQARVVELAVDEETGDLVLATAVIDHAGLVDPRTGDLGEANCLAGWSRELSLNAWQGRPSGDGAREPGEAGAEEPSGRGSAADRNVVLVVPAPFVLQGTDCVTRRRDDDPRVKATR
jgi:metallophosphoesterase (TIGR03767 family)